MIETDEIAAVRDYIFEGSERLLRCTDGLSRDELNWIPPAEGANSIYAIVSHAITAQEGLILRLVFGQQTEPRPNAGWGAEGDSAEALRERWKGVRSRLDVALSGASRADLQQECEHPRLGKMTGYQMLLHVLRHTTEHVGHVELTRDMAKAAGV